MITLFKLIFLKEYKYYYPEKKYIFINLVTELFSLLVLMMMSQAFELKTQFLTEYNISYFTFLLIGEECLKIPSLLLMLPTRSFKQLSIEGVLDRHLIGKNILRKTLTLSTLSFIMIEFVILALVLLIAKLFMSLQISFLGIFSILLIQLLFIPIFLGLGFLSLAIFIKLRRGEGFITKATSVLTVLSGAYFPATLFPEFMYGFLNNFSPYNIILNITRSVAGHTSTTIDLLKYGSLSLVFTILFVLLGIFSFEKLINEYKRKNAGFNFLL